AWRPGPVRDHLHRLMRTAARRTAALAVALVLGVGAAALPAAAAEQQPAGAPPASAAPPQQPQGTGEPASAPLPVGALATTPAGLPAVSTYTGPPEPFARYVAQVSCDPVLRPGVSALREHLRSTYGGSLGPTTRSCDNGRTEHSDGRAYDWMLDITKPADRAKAEDFLAWLVGPDAQGEVSGNARRLGIMYVIWDRRIWGSYNQQWKTYSGSSPHRDHIHLSLSWDGAMKRTSFWRGQTLSGFDYGPCQVYVGEAVPRYAARNPAPCAAPVPRPTPSTTPAVTGGTPLTGDWDGDGRDEPGWFRDGRVSLRLPGGEVRRYSFGRAGDVPVVGDWDGDGVDSVGVFRAGQWFLRDAHSSGTHDVTFRYGGPGDVPVVGAWTGRRLGVGVVASHGTRWLLAEGLGGPVRAQMVWGRAGDQPFVGDWDGDGSDTPGLRRGKDRFLLPVWRNVPAGPVVVGRAGMVALAGDFDGDGADSLGVVLGRSTFAWRDDVRSGPATGSTVFGG
ncbi:hypothetical protein WDZ17_14965, partial [Pseudokineococcus basanitobsidens]